MRVIEEWRKWRTGDYEVSSLGRVRRASPGRRTFPGRAVTLILQKCGYYSARPVIDGRNVQTYVHAMVAECFIGPRPDGFTVNHIDGNKRNNCASNLEYLTHAGNMAHAARAGLSARGERHGAAIASDADVRAIRMLRAAGWSLPMLSERFGLSRSALSQIANGHRWGHVR